MSLISVARAMDDQRFKWRVSAASIIAAAEHADDPTDTDSYRYASYVLDNPMSDDRTMYALVASNPAIAANVVVDEFDTVNTEDVPDNDIQFVVGQVWDQAARAKYNG